MPKYTEQGSCKPPLYDEVMNKKFHFLLTEKQKNKLKDLGGSQFLRDQIDTTNIRDSITNLKFKIKIYTQAVKLTKNKELTYEKLIEVVTEKKKRTEMIEKMVREVINETIDS